MSGIGKEGIAKDFILFQCRRNVVLLAKHYLESLEDLRKEHEEMLEKLKELAPDKTKEIELINYFTNSKFETIRKRIFDASGSSFNEILSILEKCEIELSGNYNYKN